MRLAAEYGSRLEVHMHGYPARKVFPKFEQEIAAVPNVIYHGSYSSPADLKRVYSDIDVLWAADWFEQGYNSVWQLPNRIYEGGFYGVPAITCDGTETAKRVVSQDSGWAVPAPFEDHVSGLVQHLLRNPAEQLQKSENLVRLPAGCFVETPKEMRDLIFAAFAGRVSNTSV